jgi:hypothetical protein
LAISTIEPVIGPHCVPASLKFTPLYQVHPTKNLRAAQKNSKLQKKKKKVATPAPTSIQTQKKYV